jgi:quercetin dioxygenase-like cupin family protein
MEFVKRQPTGKAPAGRFTADVWWDVIVAGQEPSRMRANLVRFSPGTRTHWHSHAVGRTLHVVSGTALIGTRDGTILEARPGETAACPPGEEHWHGAAPDRFMEHIALWEGTGDDTPRPRGPSPSPTPSTAAPVPPAADPPTLPPADAGQVLRHFTRGPRHPTHAATLRSP